MVKTASTMLPLGTQAPDFNLVNVDGTGLEQVTFNDTFDGFPMFSPDGTKVVFASNRLATHEGDTNVFIADWVESPGK